MAHFEYAAALQHELNRPTSERRKSASAAIPSTQARVTDAIAQFDALHDDDPGADAREAFVRAAFPDAAALARTLREQLAE